MKNFERLLPIVINEAKIKSISIDYTEMNLGVSVTVGLMTEDKKMLTSISLCNASYVDNKLEVPIEVSSIAGKLEEILRVAVIRNINKFQKKLEHKE